MYFSVDESGHTGPNLFDEKQPTLFYGVLSSNLNLDVVLEESVVRMRRNLGVARLHASEIRADGLARIAGDLHQLQRRYTFQLDCFRVQITMRR